MPNIYAYLSLFMSSFLAATILPFSSEGVLGVMIHQGYAPFLCVVIATLGNMLGGVTSYYLGYLGKWEWLKKYFGISKQQLRRPQQYIEKYGSVIAFFAWLPIVGDPLAVALGFFRVSFWKVAFWMLFGKFLRYLVLYLFIIVIR